MKLLVVVVSYRVTDLTVDCLRSLSTEIHRVPGARVAVCENGTGGDAAERIQADLDPPHLLGDAIRNSVFATGFGKRPVQNPALLPGSAK
jgi:hypothetical protein